MVAADTNVLVRLIAMDDASQLQTAEQLVADRGIFVSHLVLVETAWVLASVHRLDRLFIVQALRSLLRAGNVQTELEDWALWALERAEDGADLADMLLLVASRDQEGFATFDQRLSKKAGPTSPVPVETLR